MSSTTDDGQRGGTSVVALNQRGTWPASVRAKGKMGRKLKSMVPSPARAVADRFDSCRAVASRQRKGLRATENFGQLSPQNVESLEKYMPGSEKYQVSLTFSGEAGARISELMAKLGVDTPNEVVKFTIALLLSAQGKEILFRDPETGVVQTVEV